MEVFPRNIDRCCRYSIHIYTYQIPADLLGWVTVPMYFLPLVCLSADSSAMIFLFP